VTTTYGMIGLGRMGGNMSRRIARAGLEVIAWDRAAGARSALTAEAGIRTVETLEELATGLPTPRVVWMMLPAGEPTGHERVSGIGGVASGGHGMSVNSGPARGNEETPGGGAT